MSMDNYGRSGYGFEASGADATYDRTMDFIRKHLTDEGQELFRNCECLEDIEEVCSRVDDFGFRYNASGILAFVIAEKTGQDVLLCGDDSGIDWIMLLPAFPWETTRPMSREDFEKEAGELAREFFGEEVRFDWHTTEEWG